MEKLIGICDEVAFEGGGGGQDGVKVSEEIPQFFKQKPGVDSANLCTSLGLDCFSQILRIRMN